MGKTLAEKILSRVCGRDVVPGETVYPDPDLFQLTDAHAYHDGVSIVDELKALGYDRVYQPEKLMMTRMHTSPVTGPGMAEAARRIREAARQLGAAHYREEGFHGIEYNLPIEEGLIGPGSFVFGGDTHVANIGAVGAMGVPLPFEIITVLATGTVWIRVPESIRIELVGRLPAGVLSRDIVLWVVSDVKPERGNYRVFEYWGSGMSQIGIDGRITLCNVPVQIGAKSAIVEPDEVTLEYVRPRLKGKPQSIKSDPDAHFEHTFRYDLSRLEPLVALPPEPDNVKSVAAVAGTRVHRALVGSCANGMLDDLRAAAGILKGRRVHHEVIMTVCPATQQVFKAAAREGLLETFIDAGVSVMEPGCSICYGSIATPADGEAVIGTITRNEPGRTGNFKADIYLASPATVAASAIRGEITDPREFF